MSLGERDIRALVREVGGQLLDLKRNKHFKGTVRRPDGSTFTAIFPCSPRCPRWRDNAVNQLRKKMENRE